ncbi:hypothetical protein BD310DRAFT_727990 [Dichomitus squalens]|uniref:Uncharacterized protein n=1 Tax=Dichomitus squalens TaxID=114155 RepID=A0A4Q9PKW6_9APHY|nr:hypothetical protein BD310DRAFT_727990 [Dichomitus squalens]
MSSGPTQSRHGSHGTALTICHIGGVIRRVVQVKDGPPISKVLSNRPKMAVYPHAHGQATTSDDVNREAANSSSSVCSGRTTRGVRTLSRCSGGQEEDRQIITTKIDNHDPSAVWRSAEPGP